MLKYVDPKYIQSDDMRAYLKTVARNFTDFEQAAIVFSIVDVMEYRNLALRDILTGTKDEELKKQIRERLTKDEEALKKYNDNRKAYYTVAPSVDTYGCDCEEHFESVATAYEYAKRFKQNRERLPFEITKQLINKADVENAEEKKYEKITVYYDKNGNLLEYKINGIGRLVGASYLHSNVFERARVSVPYPFTSGDVVQDIVTGIRGVVEEIWDDCEQIGADNIEGVFIEYINDDGVVTRKCVNPFYLRYTKVSDRNPKGELINAMSRLLGGEESLEEFLYLYNFHINKSLSKH